MSGQIVKAAGFMYPLEEGKTIKNFCLLRTTQTCCYGPKPQFNQYIFVEMKKAVNFERIKPVIVTGKFLIDPKPEDGYIYRIEGTEVNAAMEEKPEEKLSLSNIPAEISPFDFKPLEALEPPQEVLANVNELKDFPDIKKFPEKLTKFEGKLMTVEAYIVTRTKNTDRFVVGENWWDGCCQGTPPSFFNAIVIVLKKGEKSPDMWSTGTFIFTGTMHICRDKLKWPDNGIVRLENAVRGVPKK